MVKTQEQLCFVWSSNVFYLFWIEWSQMVWDIKNLYTIHNFINLNHVPAVTFSQRCFNLLITLVDFFYRLPTASSMVALLRWNNPTASSKFSCPISWMLAQIRNLCFSGGTQFETIALTLAWVRSALARQTNCLCPKDRFFPLSPSSQSSPPAQRKNEKFYVGLLSLAALIDGWTAFNTSPLFNLNMQDHNVNKKCQECNVTSGK